MSAATRLLGAVFIALAILAGSSVANSVPSPQFTAAPAAVVVPASMSCATRSEYARVRANDTETPAKVQWIFGVRGTRVGAYSYVRAGKRVHVYVYRYRPCGAGRTAPYVFFHGWVGHPATAFKKTWR